MFNLKMKKTEINKLILKVSEENVTYGLILKLEYIYGRNVSEVLNLKKDDVDLNQMQIKFKTSKSDLIVPIVDDIRNVLTSYINGLPENEDYLFLNDDIKYDVGILSKRVNYFLNGFIDELNKGADYKLPKITNRDLKRLRGQHLYLDNVPVEIIHLLYNNFNLTETRNFIDYDALKESYGYDNVENLLINYTDLNLFEDESYSKESIFVVFDMNDEYGVVEFDDGELIVHEESTSTNLLSKFDVDEIYEKIKCLNDGEYKFVHGLKFLK